MEKAADCVSRMVETNSRASQTEGDCVSPDSGLAKCVRLLQSLPEFRELACRVRQSCSGETTVTVTRDNMAGLLGGLLDPVTLSVTATGLCYFSVLFRPLDIFSLNLQDSADLNLHLFRDKLGKLSGRAGYGFCPGLKESDFPPGVELKTHGFEVFQQPFRRVQAEKCPVFWQQRPASSCAGCQDLDLKLCPACVKAVADAYLSLQCKGEDVSSHVFTRFLSLGRPPLYPSYKLMELKEIKAETVVERSELSKSDADVDDTSVKTENGAEGWMNSCSSVTSVADLGSMRPEGKAFNKKNQSGSLHGQDNCYSLTHDNLGETSILEEETELVSRAYNSSKVCATSTTTTITAPTPTYTITTPAPTSVTTTATTTTTVTQPTPGLCLAAAPVLTSPPTEASLSPPSWPMTSFSESSKNRPMKKPTEDTAVCRPILSARVTPYRYTTHLDVTSATTTTLHDVTSNTATTPHNVTSCVTTSLRYVTRYSGTSSDMPSFTATSPDGCQVSGVSRKRRSSQRTLSSDGSPGQLVIDEDFDPEELTTAAGEQELKRSCHRCPVCQKAFPSNTILQAHNNRQHPPADLSPASTPHVPTDDDAAVNPQTMEQNIWQTACCRGCPVRSCDLNQKTEEKHLVEDRHTKLCSCRCCGEKFALKKNVLKQLKHYRGFKTKVCKDNSTKIAAKRSKAVAYKNHCTKWYRDSKAKICKDCGNNFVSKEQFTAHVPEHTGGVPDLCIPCAKTCRRHKVFVEHVSQLRGRQGLRAMKDRRQKAVHEISSKAKTCLEGKMKRCGKKVPTVIEKSTSHNCDSVQGTNRVPSSEWLSASFISARPSSSCRDRVSPPCATEEKQGLQQQEWPGSRLSNSIPQDETIFFNKADNQHSTSILRTQSAPTSAACKQGSSSQVVTTDTDIVSRITCNQVSQVLDQVSKDCAESTASLVVPTNDHPVFNAEESAVLTNSTLEDPIALAHKLNARTRTPRPCPSTSVKPPSEYEESVKGPSPDMTPCMDTLSHSVDEKHESSACKVYLLKTPVLDGPHLVERAEQNSELHHSEETSVDVSGPPPSDSATVPQPSASTDRHSSQEDDPETRLSARERTLQQKERELKLRETAINRQKQFFQKHYMEWRSAQWPAGVNRDGGVGRTGGDRTGVGRTGSPEKAMAMFSALTSAMGGKQKGRRVPAFRRIAPKPTPTPCSASQPLTDTNQTQNLADKGQEEQAKFISIAASEGMKTGTDLKDTHIIRTPSIVDCSSITSTVPQTQLPTSAHIALTTSTLMSSHSVCNAAPSGQSFSSPSAGRSPANPQSAAKSSLESKQQEPSSTLQLHTKQQDRWFLQEVMRLVPKLPPSAREFLPTADPEGPPVSLPRCGDVLTSKISGEMPQTTQSRRSAWKDFSRSVDSTAGEKQQNRTRGMQQREAVCLSGGRVQEKSCFSSVKVPAQEVDRLLALTSLTHPVCVLKKDSKPLPLLPDLQPSVPSTTLVSKESQEISQAEEASIPSLPAPSCSVGHVTNRVSPLTFQPLPVISVSLRPMPPLIPTSVSDSDTSNCWQTFPDHHPPEDMGPLDLTLSNGRNTPPTQRTDRDCGARECETGEQSSGREHSRRRRNPVTQPFQPPKVTESTMLKHTCDLLSRITHQPFETIPLAPDSARQNSIPHLRSKTMPHYLIPAATEKVFHQTGIDYHSDRSCGVGSAHQRLWSSLYLPSGSAQSTEVQPPADLTCHRLSLPQGMMDHHRLHPTQDGGLFLWKQQNANSQSVRMCDGNMSPILCTTSFVTSSPVSSQTAPSSIPALSLTNGSSVASNISGPPTASSLNGFSASDSICGLSARKSSSMRPQDNAAANNAQEALDLSPAFRGVTPSPPVSLFVEARRQRSGFASSTSAMPSDCLPDPSVFLHPSNTQLSHALEIASDSSATTSSTLHYTSSGSIHDKGSQWKPRVNALGGQEAVWVNHQPVAQQFPFTHQKDMSFCPTNPSNDVTWRGGKDHRGGGGRGEEEGRQLRHWLQEESRRQQQLLDILREKRRQKEEAGQRARIEGRMNE